MKTKTYGFTLIELLAVIVVLAIIMVIATQQVNTTIKKARYDSNEINKKSIAKAAELCLTQENNEDDCNTVDKLVDGGYLERFEDPYTKSNEFVSQNYPITFDNNGNATVDYFGQGYIEDLTEEIKEKDYFKWDGNSITGLTTEGLNWVKENNWTLVFPTNATKIDTSFAKSNFCSTGGRKTVIIPGNIKTIGHGSFIDCGITSLYLNSGIEKIEYDAFYKNKISYLQIPNSSIEIGRGSFSINNLPDDQAFIYKRTKTGIDYTTLVAYGGTKKNNVIVPDSVETIADYAFYQGKIESIILPSNLKKISSGAFLSNSLSNIIIPKTVNYIGSMAFASNKLTQLDVSFVEYLGSGYVSDNSFSIDKAIVYDKNDPTKINSFASNGQKLVIIPEGVKSIGSSAFTYTNTNTVNLPESLERIENNAFSVSSIKNIVIPKNVNFIGANAFYACNPSSIMISNQNPYKETFKSNWKSYGLSSDIIGFTQ